MRFRFTDEKGLVSFVIKATLPEWQTKLFKKFSDAIQVHSHGQIFYKIDRLFPNEHAESKNHRILAFESVTEASFGRAANNVNRIFKNSSYTVEASEKTIEYSKAPNFCGHNFYNWFLDEWVKWALKEDSNARIVAYPPAYVEETGRPPVAFIASEHLKHISEDVVVFICEEESVVKYELEEVKLKSEVFYDYSIKGPNIRHAEENTYMPKLVSKITRAVYHAFVKDKGFFRIEELQNDQKEFEVDFFPIKGDVLPITDAGGEKGKKDVTKSFLYPFVSFGNLALLQHSQHTAVNFSFSFPRMSEIQTPCDQPGCQEGFIECPTTTECPDGRMTCGKCKGSGFTANQTPYKAYIKRFDPQGMEGDQKYLEVDDVKFYTPETSILDYSKNEWKNYLEMAETAVYIQQRVQTGNVEAAKSKEIDREDLYAFLYRVGQEYFTKLRFVLQCFENFLVGKPVHVNVNIPYSYAILSEGEAFEALKDILSSSVPLMLKASQVESFINKFVSESSPIRKFLDVLKTVDPLLYYTFNEISSLKANFIVTPEQYSNHVFGYPALQQMYSKDKNLFLQETSAIADKLKADLLQYKPIEPKTMKEKFLPEP